MEGQGRNASRRELLSFERAFNRGNCIPERDPQRPLHTSTFRMLSNWSSFPTLAYAVNYVFVSSIVNARVQIPWAI